MFGEFNTGTFLLFLGSFAAFVAFAYKRSLIYLRYFQQEEYDARRFLRWYVTYRAFDKRGTAVVLVSYLLSLFSSSLVVGLLVFLVGMLGLVFTQKDPRRAGKIKLNMTARATRIFMVACALAFLTLLVLFIFCFKCPVVSSVLFLQLLPIFILLSNISLSPFEKRTKLKYYNEAKAILSKVDPYIIGITGSYGKTSVKAALGEVLQATLGPTFCPPKSINTVMGITREIRERMTPAHKYAVIEMGAYNVGSIKRLCDFTPPVAGIVTVVGMAHLERYGSVERVYKAKSELPQAIPQSGILVCNGDNEGARRMTSEFPKEQTYLYGFKNESGDLHCAASEVKFLQEGTSFEILWRGSSYSGFTRLLGMPALSNLLGVFTMACALGADPEHVLAVIRNIQPVDNRLMLTKEGSVSYLRDAYNSNPDGFAAALDVLAELPAERRILMTPGMIELGDKQYEENKKAALRAAEICDLVILVGTVNEPALREGLLEGGMNEENIFSISTRDGAFQKLGEVSSSGDLILIENDLPDLYEVEEKF